MKAESWPSAKVVPSSTVATSCRLMAGAAESGDELPARLRAAIGYAGNDLTAQRLADELRMSKGQISHYVAGTKPIPRSRERPLIEAAARLSGLPSAFFSRPGSLAEMAEDAARVLRGATPPPPVEE